MALRIPKIKQSRVQTASLPAPTAGWNTKDSYASMDSHYAPVISDWWPQPSYVELRKGYTQWATGFPSNVNSVMGYTPSSGTAKLFGAAGSGIYDATATGAISSAVVTGLTSNKFQHVEFSTAGGHFLVACNGSDSVYNYDGSSWTNPSITGVTSANLVSVDAHKNRLWFVEKNSTSAWYLGTKSISGAASQFDLGSVFNGGGYLQAIGTWTLDAGYGLDDYCVFVSSTGQVAVYQGTDPSSSTTWSLIGVYQVGQPIGYRCLKKYGGDLLIMCMNGVFPLSRALQSTTINLQSALSYNIQQAISTATSEYSSNFGWEMAVYPLANMLIVNVPVTTTTGQQQYVMNTLHGAWTNFTNWPANSFAVWDNQLWFGGDDFIAKAWNGYQDGSASISADVIQAYSYFGQNTALKRFTMTRPIFTTSGSPSISMRVNTDFDFSEPSAILTFSPSSYGVWDTSTWDSAIWGGSDNIKKNWQGSNAIGYAAAAHFEVQSNVSVKWMSTDYVYELGSVL